MSKSFELLNPNQRIALVCLLKGESFEEAAERAHVTSRTLRRWRLRPDFQAAYAAAERDFFAVCRAEVAAARAQAFSTLREMARWNSDSAVRARAAIDLLKYVSRPEMSAPQAGQTPNPPAFNDLTENAADIRGHRRTNEDVSRTFRPRRRTMTVNL